MGAPTHEKSPRFRVWLSALLPGVLLLAAALFWFSHVPRERDAAVESWKRDLGLRADFRRDALNSFLRDALADAALLASFPAVQAVASGADGRAHFEEIV